MAKNEWIADDAYGAYVEWLASVDASDTLNEDTTRMRLIDAILFDVLRWDRNFVETEPYVTNEGYADYIFNVKGGTAMVLEAKRIGATFTLPIDGGYPERAVSFELIADKCGDAHKAMTQAVTYANGVGARYTAISNGRQWIMMLTLVEGAVLKRRNVVVFESLEAIRASNRMARGLR